MSTYPSFPTLQTQPRSSTRSFPWARSPPAWPAVPGSRGNSGSRGAAAGAVRTSDPSLVDAFSPPQDVAWCRLKCQLTGLVIVWVPPPWTVADPVAVVTAAVLPRSPQRHKRRSPPQHKSSSGTPGNTATTQNLACGQAVKGRATAQSDRPLDAVYVMLFTDVIEIPRLPGGQPAHLRDFEGHHSCYKSKLSDAIQPDPTKHKNPQLTLPWCAELLTLSSRSLNFAPSR